MCRPQAQRGELSVGMLGQRRGQAPVDFDGQVAGQGLRELGGVVTEHDLAGRVGVPTSLGDVGQERGHDAPIAATRSGRVCLPAGSGIRGAGPGAPFRNVTTGRVALIDASRSLGCLG